MGDTFFFGQLFSSWFNCHLWFHSSPSGSFLNCTHSSSHFWGTKSSLMLCQGCRIATWRGEGAERWIMPPASAWGPATEHCPRPTSNQNAADALPYARRYAYFHFPEELELNKLRVTRSVHRLKFSCKQSFCLRSVNHCARVWNMRSVEWINFLHKTLEKKSFLKSLSHDNQSFTTRLLQPK